MEGHDIVKRYDGMDKDISAWKNLWQECSDWCLPAQSNINFVRTPGTEKPPQRFIDIGIEALNTFGAGFFSHNFPPGTIWAKFEHPDPSVMMQDNVAVYFEAVSKELNSVLVSSNFAQEEFQSLLALGCFGTSDLCVEEDDESVVRFSNHHIASIRIAANNKGMIDTVGRKFKLTPRQAVQEFGEEALQQAEMIQLLNDYREYREGEYDFIHLIEPRMDRDPKMKDIGNKPYASYYTACETKKNVRVSGMDFNPHTIARFQVGSGEVFGRSPVMNELATLRGANVLHRSTLLSYEQSVNNQWIVSDDDTVAQRAISQRANAMIKYRASSPGGPPQRLDKNGNPLLGIDMLEYFTDRIKRSLYNSQFRPLDEYRNMTAWEAQERSTTDLMELAPFSSRYISEKVTPLMEKVYYICQKAGKFPDVPVELRDDPRFNVSYVGRLALATKSFETLGAINVMRIMAELGQAVPQAMTFFDNIDMDRMGKALWYAGSADLSVMIPEEQVNAQREAEAEQALQQQLMDNIPAAADAAQKLSGGIDPTSIMNDLREG